MIECRLRVTFWNLEYGAPQDWRLSRPLEPEFTDWTTRDRAQALGEKLIRDGVWVTAERGEQRCDHTCDTSPNETFLVPPARIREVTLETRTYSTARDGDAAIPEPPYRSDASGPPCLRFVPLVDGVGVPCLTCGHVEAQHAAQGNGTIDTAAGWHEREGG